jgi:hypothetical protein
MLAETAGAEAAEAEAAGAEAVGAGELGLQKKWATQYISSPSLWSMGMLDRIKTINFPIEASINQYPPASASISPKHQF